MSRAPDTAAERWVQAVLQVLDGQDLIAVAASSGVEPPDLLAWKEFLAAGRAALDGSDAPTLSVALCVRLR